MTKSMSTKSSWINRSIDWIIIHFLAIWIFIIRQFNSIRYSIFSALCLSPSPSSSTTTTALTSNSDYDDNNNDNVVDTKNSVLNTHHDDDDDDDEDQV